MKQNNKINPSEQKKGKKNKLSALRKKISIGYLIVAFVVSLTLWFYVADYDTIEEKTFTNIPVELIYPTKEGLVVESGEGKLINVTVHGKKADLKAMRSDDIRAYVDLSGVRQDGEMNAEIIVELPNDITLVENNALSVTHLAVTLATPTSKLLPLAANIVAGNWDDIYTVLPECELSTIEIIGSSPIVERIKIARVNIDVGDLERPKQVRGKIELIDENGETVPQTYLRICEPNGAEISNSIVGVYVSMEMVKELPVVVEFTGKVFNANDASILYNPASVKVRGGVEKLRKMDAVVIPFDETTISNSFAGFLPLPELDETLEYVDNVSEVYVAISLLDFQSTQIRFNTEDISVVGLPEGLGAKLKFLPDANGITPEYVVMTVSGYSQSILDIKREGISIIDISVDFTEFATSDTGVQAGQKYVSLDVKIAFKTLQGVFTTNEYKVSAEIFELAENANES